MAGKKPTMRENISSRPTDKYGNRATDADLGIGAAVDVQGAAAGPVDLAGKFIRPGVAHAGLLHLEVADTGGFGVGGAAGVGGHVEAAAAGDRKHVIDQHTVVGAEGERVGAPAHGVVKDDVACAAAGARAGDAGAAAGGAVLEDALPQ